MCVFNLDLEISKICSQIKQPATAHQNLDET